MTFRLDCVPPTVSHHAKRIVTIGGHARLADTPALVAARKELAVLLQPFRPKAPLAGAVILAAIFEWPWPSGRASGRLLKTSTPDCSNVIKTLEDVLVQLQFLEDDRAVAVLHVEKWWSDRPGITVTLSPLTPNECLDEGDPSHAKSFMRHAAALEFDAGTRRG